MLKNKRLMLASIVLVLAPAIALASDAPTLQEIMQGLRDNLVDITDGLLADDFELVARGATAIADHPRIPPAEVQLVAEELGTEMAVFKQLDTLVHDLSLEIETAARSLDRDAALSNYQRMLDSCVACHVAYKERVAAVLSAP